MTTWTSLDACHGYGGIDQTGIGQCIWNVLADRGSWSKRLPAVVANSSSIAIHIMFIDAISNVLAVTRPSNRSLVELAPERLGSWQATGQSSSGVTPLER